MQENELISNRYFVSTSQYFTRKKKIGTEVRVPERMAAPGTSWTINSMNFRCCYSCLKSKITPRTHKVCLERRQCFILRRVQGGRFPQITHTYCDSSLDVYSQKLQKAPPTQYSYSTYLMHIHYVTQVGSSAPAQQLCWANKVIYACAAASEGLWCSFAEEDPYSFCPFMVVCNLRTAEFLFFLPTACFTVSQQTHVLGWACL